MKIGDLWPEVAQWLVLVLLLILVVVIRAFPQVLVGGILRKVDYQNNKKIEGIRADYGTLKTTVDYLSAAQSEVQPRVVKAVEALWNAILVIKNDYLKAVGATTLMTSQEIDRCFQRPGEEPGEDLLPKYQSVAETIDCEAFRDSVSETSRLYVSDRLWLVFVSFRMVHGRLAYLFHKSLEDGKYHDWQSDRHMKTIFRNVLSEKVVDEGFGNRFGGFRDLADRLEAEFLKEARYVLYGSQALSEQLSDHHAILRLEQKEVGSGRSA